MVTGSQNLERCWPWPAAGGWGGSRRLLRQLRDLMQSGGQWQDRLDAVVCLIGDAMVAEVCSLYVMRAGEVLELFATRGLRREAVHRTRLRVGEGIIGDVASTGSAVALQDAQQHPNFAYRPETGEEIYHSMLAVPLLRDHRVIGDGAGRDDRRCGADRGGGGAP